MSCNILLDINDSPTNSGSCQVIRKNHKRIQSYFAQDKLSLLTSLCRALYLRRLKLFKFYMTAIVVCILLFFLLKSSPNNLENQLVNHDQLVTSKDMSKLVSTKGEKNEPGIVQNTKSNNIAQQTKKAIENHVEMGSDRSDSVMVGQPTYPNNLTYLLTVKDFNQMKDINIMQVRIREAMKHSWDNYRKYAWGYDMLKPRSREPDHWFNLGLTIVESADTLIMMGLTHDSNLALDWIENELKFVSNSENSNCFELTIRMLAGLLSVYHLTARTKLKEQAIEMGNVLLHCYDTESRVIPYSDIDLNNHRAHPPPWNPHSSLSEVTSIQLEFRYLSQISGNPVYEQTSFQTSLHIHNLTAKRQNKLLPMYISPTTGQLEESIITLGARSDSYYEYLLKQYLQTGLKWLEVDYLDAVDSMSKTLIRHTDGADNYTYVAEMHLYRTVNDTEEIKYNNKMDHLVCFLPGTLALGYYHFSPLAAENRLKFNLETPQHKINSRFNDHLAMAQALSRTCAHMYSNMGTGLAPEIAIFIHAQPESNVLTQTQPELQAKSTATHNILRPEFVESLFYLYHITGQQIYRKQAVEVFDAFQKYSRIPTGYSPVSDVREKPQPGADIDELLHKNAPDRMESFWLSETLKYLYLIFCDDSHIVGTLLNNYVFNTEAHLLPVL